MNLIIVESVKQPVSKSLGHTIYEQFEIRIFYKLVNI